MYKSLSSVIAVFAFLAFTSFANAESAAECNLTPLASLENNSVVRVSPGDLLTNRIILTNPNPASCGVNTYLISRGLPSGWIMNIDNTVDASGGATVFIPLSLEVALDSASGLFDYNFWIYNSWADGSGQASASGYVEVQPSPTPTPTPIPTPTPDTTSPVVSITSPADNSLIQKNKVLNISAVASDNVEVSKVEFYVNGDLICTELTADYNCSFKAINKKKIDYVITATAYDSSGNTKSASISVTTR